MSTIPIVVPVPLTIARFRQDFTEFANTAVYPDNAVTFWLSVATLMLNPDRWARLLGVGIELFAAHNLVLEAQALATVNVGGIPGITKGPVTSEAAGAVSVSYDVQAGINKDAAHWNLTTYGTRLYKLMMIFGAGPVHLGTGLPVGNGTQIGGVGFVFPPFTF